MQKDYFIGLDMGTSSVGWAVTDEQYKLLRKKGKDMWGVRLFNEAETSAGRRSLRTARRRLQREKVRIGYLREYFADEIEKVDPGFYQRLEDSKFYAEDKDIMQKNAIFSDKNYTDKNYFHDYATIYHLRKELIDSKEEHDVRLVYLAILNIFKHRGHFLNTNLGNDGIGNLADLYTEFVTSMEELFDIEVGIREDHSWLEKILSSREYSNSHRLDLIISELGIIKKNDKRQIEIWKLICGLKATLAVVFSIEEVGEENKKFNLSFKDAGFDEKMIQAEEMLSEDKIEFLYLLKQIHDWGLLANIMKSEKYISYAKVSLYEKHEKDLRILKALYKQSGSKAYNEMFRIMKPDNYSGYVGSVDSSKEKKRRGVKKDTEKFFKNIKSVLESVTDSEEKQYVLNEIEKDSFLPLQVDTNNGVIPYQVHKTELCKILANAEGYLPFLKLRDDSGLTVSERIIMIFGFQIPYYVGPISPMIQNFNGSKNVWSVRKSSGPVMPWNFEEKIDEVGSSEKFITKMVRHCTYLDDEMVLPKNSLLYERFMLLNELNKLRINDEPITPELKQKMYSYLFGKGRRVKKAGILRYLIRENIVDANEDVVISGIDEDVANTLSSYAKFADLFNTTVLTHEQEEIAEQIIKWSTLYGDTKKFLMRKIRQAYSDILTEEQIKKICSYRFKDWGRISKELLLTEGADKETGEVKTIISRMWDENYNLMELIESYSFTYKDVIIDKQEKLDKTLSEIEFEDLADGYFSAPVKRMVWQTILILKEIVEVMGSAPAKVFVEMARDVSAEKERKISRKKKVMDLYKNCKFDAINWSKEIENKEERDFRSKKLYLYYTQQGRCMYSGKAIDLDNPNYDIDHIYPRHFVKDDSLDNNLVLVDKTFNAHKSDNFPIEKTIQDNRKTLWRRLKEGGFINEEKYKRLTRIDEFTDEERAKFISRQIVETRQGTKVITKILEQSFKGQSEILYVKAGNVSSFRQRYELLKCRTVNDFHHANDAYLNIVVGNVYDTKFTKNPLNFVREYMKNKNANEYHMYKLFDHNVSRNGITAWTADNGKSISIVRKMMGKNTPLVTKKNYEAHGGLYKQNPVSAKVISKCKGEGYLPLKSTNDRLKDVCRYGGYSNTTGAYFFLVEYDEKGKKKRSLESMPLYLIEKISSETQLEDYCKLKLGYINPKIRIKCIRLYSLIKVNGFYMYLTGKSKKQLLSCNAVQLVLDKENTEYCRIIEKSINKGGLLEKIGISTVRNIILYDTLAIKHTESIYSRRPNAIGKILKNGRNQFLSLELEKQVFVLKQILQISQLINIGANLVDIGGKAASGVSTLNKEISRYYEIKLISQSVTGLYEDEIDLLTV